MLLKRNVLIKELERFGINTKPYKRFTRKRLQKMLDDAIQDKIDRRGKTTISNFDINHHRGNSPLMPQTELPTGLYTHLVPLSQCR